MPSNLLAADTGMPDLGGNGSVEDKLNAIQNYLYLLLENLRYTLRNLGAENFNSSELEQLMEMLRKGVLQVETVVSETVIANELYAQYGSVADLTVDRLRTDYRRAMRYLAKDTSQLDYISIHDEEISFISATTDGLRSEQLEVDGRKFWWTDAGKPQMTSLKETGWPVRVYVYQEYVKASFQFRQTAMSDGTMTASPVLVFGAGSDGTGLNGRATIRKNLYSLDINYRTTGGVDTGVYCRNDGFTDVVQRRASLRVDTESNAIVVNPEGELAESYAINYVEDENGNLTLTWPDGKSFRVEVV